MASIVAVDRRHGRARASSTTRRGSARDVLGPGLAALAEKHAVIGEVRGTGRLLGARAGRRPRHPRAAVARRVMGRAKAELLEPRPAALHRRQPHPRRATVRGHRRRGQRGAGHLRRRPHPAHQGAANEHHDRPARPRPLDRRRHRPPATATAPGDVFDPARGVRPEARPLRRPPPTSTPRSPSPRRPSPTGARPRSRSASHVMFALPRAAQPAPGRARRDPHLRARQGALRRRRRDRPRARGRGVRVLAAAPAQGRDVARTSRPTSTSTPSSSRSASSA